MNTNPHTRADLLQSLLSMLGEDVFVVSGDVAAKIERRGNQVFIGLVIPVTDPAFPGFMKRQPEPPINRQGVS